MLLHLLRGTIRKKLVVLILLSALPAFALVLASGLRNLHNSVAEGRQEVLTAARRAAESQQRAIAGTRLMLENLSKVPDVRRADVVVCTRIFTNVLRINQQRYVSLRLVDTEGRIIAPAGAPDEPGLAAARHFREALETRSFAVGEYPAGSPAEGAVLSFGCPVYDDEGRLHAVLLAGVSLRDYGKLYDGLHFPEASFLGLSDVNGIRLYRSPETPAAPPGQPIRANVFAAARDASATTDEGLTEDTGPDGVERMVGFRPLRLGPGKPAYMYVFVSVPVASVRARAMHSLLRDLGLLLLMVALTLCSGWFLGGRDMGRRLEELAAAAKRIGGGDLEARVRPEPGVAEIDVLARSFNGMAEDLSRDREARLRTEAELRDARALAEAANRAKSQFLANMSHELRTPLNGLLGMLQLIKGGGLPGQTETFVEMALRSGQRLTTLLGDLLDLSRIEAGFLRIQCRPFALSGVFAALAETFSPMHHSKRVPLIIGSAPGVPPLLMGDEVRVRQLLFNLVGNAMKFTEQGEVRLEVQPLLPLPGGEARLLFLVSDTGIGIPDDKLDLICRPFTQVAEDFTRAQQGAGLGLAIVHSLVKAMRGTLDFDSELGKGTSVALTLPFGLMAQGAAAAEERDGREPGANRSLRILLVEDDEVSRLSARVLLERMGHEVLTAANGAEALDALRAGRFDCVLMDVQMDVMNGVDATRHIRGGSSGVLDARVPIIAMTAYAMGGDRERFLAAGMDDYLAKPMLLEALQAALGRVALGAARRQ